MVFQGSNYNNTINIDCGLETHTTTERGREGSTYQVEVKFMYIALHRFHCYMLMGEKSEVSEDNYSPMWKSLLLHPLN